MRLILISLLFSLSCLPAQPGPSHGSRLSRRWGGRRRGRGWSTGGGGGGVGGNKIAVGTQCRLVKQSGGGGGGNCFQEQECGQVCSTVSQTQCSTVSESQCSTVSVPQCRSLQPLNTPHSSPPNLYIINLSKNCSLIHSVRRSYLHLVATYTSPPCLSVK